LATFNYSIAKGNPLGLRKPVTVGAMAIRWLHKNPTPLGQHVSALEGCSRALHDKITPSTIVTKDHIMAAIALVQL